MNSMLHLSSWYFAAAGAVCAAGPLVIHLFNRRRFRVVPWAAMDFLYEALRRERRILRLRDLLLLVLRTAAVFLFGMALARPYLSGAGTLTDAHSPRHAVFLIDNSLSMGYQQLDGTLLDRAKREARQLIRSLPDGSRISVLGVCNRQAASSSPLRRKEDAIRAIDALTIVDRTARVDDVAAAARSAIHAAPPLADQLVLFTDAQRINWPRESAGALLAELPPLLVRDLSARPWTNTWVQEIRLRDDVVDVSTPTTVLVTLRHRGARERRVQVSLSVDGSVVATRSANMTSGQSEQRVSFETTFADVAIQPGTANFVPVTVSLTPDRLPLDDQRSVMVPVLAAVPVVFVDQFRDDEEDAALGRLGETRPLRQLLAPVRAGKARRRQMIQVRHLTIGQLNRSQLADARLVVIGGIDDPTGKVDLLREYVEQGGTLVIAAGGRFDPAAWNRAAWRGGNGVLPSPLAEVPIGAAIDEGDDSLKPFFLSAQSMMTHPLFRLAGLSDAELLDLYREPIFFKAIGVDLGVETNERLMATEIERLRTQSRTTTANRPSNTAPSNWLNWGPAIGSQADLPIDVSGREDSLREIAGRTLPRVCGRYRGGNEQPFMIARRIGRGQVLLVTTGLLPSWNDLAQTNAVVLWDHCLRRLIRSTLPRRNFQPQPRIVLPLAWQERDAVIKLQRPGEEESEERLESGFVGRDTVGVIISDCWARGLYRVEVDSRGSAGDKSSVAPLWTGALAISGDAAESDLAPLTGKQRQALGTAARIQWLEAGETLALGGQGAGGQAYWWWFLFATLIMLLIELGILALPWAGGRMANRAAAANSGEASV